MVTLTYQDILIAVLLVLAIILVIYFIVIAKRLLPVVKNLDQISKDAMDITKSAKESIDEVEHIVKDAKKSSVELGASVKKVCNLLDGKKNTIGALTTLTNAAASLVNLLKK